MSELFRIGIDIGSTTIKIVILDSFDNIIFSSYTRHRSDIRSTMIASLEKALEKIDDEA